MIKLAFIGFGRMGLTHFSILNSHPGVQITAVCDASSTMMSVLNSLVPVRTYCDAGAMVEKEDLDGVVISTPSDSHAEFIGTALAHGLHVFSEKPFVLSVADGEKILSQIKERPLVNQVGYVNRFNEVFAEIKEHLQNGLIGELKSFSSEMYAPTVLKDAKGSWRAKRHSGGGCLYELGCHCIDLAVFLFGQPDRVAGSSVFRVFSSDVEDIASTSLMYDGRYSGSILVNWSDEACRKPANIVKAFGTKGKIIADKHAFRVFLKEERPDLGFSKGWNTRSITEIAKPVRFYLRGNEFTRQLDYFVACMENGSQENISSFSEAAKTDWVIEEIRRDAATPAAASLAGPAHTGAKTIKHDSFFKKFLK
jgi:predicted dehydrogenase